MFFKTTSTGKAVLNKIKIIQKIPLLITALGVRKRIREIIKICVIS
jgi:hypothetical protein